jgi:hypothetical protein
MSPSKRSRPGLSELPDVFPLWPTAGQFLGLGRNLTFESARCGAIPTLRFGKRLMVSRRAIERLLDEGQATPATSPVGPLTLTRRAARSEVSRCR